MSISPELDVVMFDQPSGNVRGMVSAFTQIKGKSVRVGHATLLTDREPAVALGVPRSVDLADIAALTETLTAFANRVNDLHVQQQQ